jgi:hypothetical protein
MGASHEHAFHCKIQNDRTLLTEMNYYQDLCCQLHLLGIVTAD